MSREELERKAKKKERKQIITVFAVIIIFCAILVTSFTLLRREYLRGKAVFKVSELELYPNEGVVGKPFQATVVVKNVGDSAGSYLLEFKVGDETVETREVYLSAGASKQVAFQLTPKKPGILEIEIDGLEKTFVAVLLIEAYELYEEYKENEIAADAKYKNQILYVEGEIISIGREILGKPYVVLAGDTLFGVQCVFDKEHEPRIAQLTKGQWVTVRGRCKGEAIWNVLLDDCSLID